MKREFEALATLVAGLALIACFLVPVKRPTEPLQMLWSCDDIQYGPHAADNPLVKETMSLKAAREAAKAATTSQPLAIVFELQMRGVH